ncbi:DMSO/selenate family reductase complex B subunit [Paraferrimonas sedimenticola]|uniref:Dimethylsulfoxide reductase, chain B n=1 Tax=Paraferrimonas sedimenticola TaxID=375674 RepID=A0AA37RUR1_9GAMM|nr:DMSO/selenate family reductase complex B subunit [Paraferrimonas sedimenticola]GLP95689.1 dimethylsulfoxide reductase, chain B [Paraferrimonas sedimenticola]
MSQQSTFAAGEAIPFVEYDAVSDEQLGFYIDSSICSGCKACQVSCQDNKQLDVGQRFRRVYEKAGGGFEMTEAGGFTNSVFAYTVSIACNHCDKPMCMRRCPTDAIHKREGDGIVRINTDTCIGCGNCAKSCPYKAPQMNPKTGKADKCDFCIDRLAQGQQPVCVKSCPLHAIEFGPISQLRKKYGELAEVNGLPTAKMTRPNLVIKPNRGALKKPEHAQLVKG